MMINNVEMVVCVNKKQVGRLQLDILVCIYFPSQLVSLPHVVFI